MPKSKSGELKIPKPSEKAYTLPKGCGISNLAAGETPKSPAEPPNEPRKKNGPENEESIDLRDCRGYHFIGPR